MAAIFRENEPGVSVGTSFLQVRDKMLFPRNEALGNAVPQPIRFTSKSLTNTETYHSSLERKALLLYP